MKMHKAIRLSWQKKCYCRPLGWKGIALGFYYDGQMPKGRLYEFPSPFLYFSEIKPAPIPAITEAVGEWEILTAKELEQEVHPLVPPENQGAM